MANIENFSLEYLYETFGYLGLLMYGWIGFMGLPLPNEVIVMTNGYMAGKGIFHPLLAYICTYMSIVAVLCTSFTAGRLFSRLYSQPLKSKKFQQSRKRLEAYGKKALTLSVFIPGFRLLIPCAAGYSRFRYADLVKYSLFPNAIWTSFYFTAGFFFFEKPNPRSWDTGFLLIGLAIVCSFFILRYLFKKASKLKQSTRG
ncbi:DedA family protein [Bacillus thermotolerans]|uniref:DedA family protein n=1 Tax=Bacillus thermotolerans TaxID=1221996 RepID=A0A0F5I1X3_BACTR|nr:VTT domain-containing protein [Bacillus thermotolerans]KKB39132.1 dedA family protein [Bacillus thermotolerans]KKB41581.1 dedA family protein [Bacillus thermotolerans]KKB42752.1 dedA family protein [Bacillus thermotolerans]